MMTKHDLELADFAGLASRLKLVAENGCSTSLEADQARGFISEPVAFLERYKDIKNRLALNGETVGHAQIESLKSRIVDFLSAVRDRWNDKCDSH